MSTSKFEIYNHIHHVVKPQPSWLWMQFNQHPPYNPNYLRSTIIP